jgi:hypothetical protein
LIRNFSLIIICQSVEQQSLERAPSRTNILRLGKKGYLYSHCLFSTVSGLLKSSVLMPFFFCQITRVLLQEQIDLFIALRLFPPIVTPIPSLPAPP